MRERVREGLPIGPSLVWGFEKLALAAISGIAVVQDEYLHDFAKAHATINQLADAARLDSHQIDDRRVSVYFSEENFAEAHWLRAAKTEKWDAAAAWFEQVQRWLPQPKDKPFVAGALADAAYAFWKAGKPKESVIAATEAWVVADSLPSGREDLRAFATIPVLDTAAGTPMRTLFFSNKQLTDYLKS